jgi:hypothetical protein
MFDENSVVLQTQMKRTAGLSDKLGHFCRRPKRSLAIKSMKFTNAPAHIKNSSSQNQKFKNPEFSWN